MAHGQEDNEQPHPCILPCTSKQHAVQPGSKTSRGDAEPTHHVTVELMSTAMPTHAASVGIAIRLGANHNHNGAGPLSPNTMCNPEWE